MSSGTEDRSTVHGTSCLGIDGGTRGRREGAGGGIVPDCDKSISGIPHHSKRFIQ